MKTRTASSIQNGTRITGTTTLAVTAQPTNLHALEGYCGGTAGTTYYLQLVSLAVPVTNATVPLWSKPITGGQGFSFVYPDGGISTQNLTSPPNTDAVYAIISSNDTVFTSVAFNSDIEVDYEEYEQQVDSGQTTTSANNAGSLVVWSDDYANPGTLHSGYGLLSLTVTNNTGAAIWVMLFTSTSQATAGATPLKQLNVPAGSTSSALSSGAPTGELTIGASYTWKFGSPGKPMFSFDSTGAGHDGCYIYASSTAATLTAIANSVNYSATYTTTEDQP